MQPANKNFARNRCASMSALGKSGWIFVVLLVALFAAGAWELTLAPLESGEVYPPYSSLRSDPLGAKALFESLAELPELKVSRLYKRGAKLNRDTTLFELGMDSVAWAAQPAPALAGTEKLLAGGGRLVIAFVPTPGRASAPGEEQAMGDRWHLSTRYQEVPAGERNSGLIPRESALNFVAGPEWRVLESRGGDATTVERELAGGTLVLVADSFPLSNQGLSETPEAARIAQLVGSAQNVVFDETHFGVTETGSVVVLLRKYRLEGALTMLALVAGLFIWRNSSSFLPTRESLREEPVAGRDSSEGMTALLHRSVPERELLQTCWTQWSRSAAPQARAEQMKSVIDQGAQGSLVEVYRAACRVLTERK